MAESSKDERIAADKISKLPRIVIDRILDCMRTRDAARTCILSRHWRYIWSDHSSIVLDRQFSKEIIHNTDSLLFQNDFVNIVNKILLQHLGSIQKFVLDISDLDPTRYSDVDTWILFLSRKGVEELTLHNSYLNPYKIPSCIFSCLELTYLSISNCILRSACNFEGFRKLNELVLQKVTFESSFVISNPLLVCLRLENCKGLRDINIYAPRLQMLFLLENDNIELSYCMICKNKKDTVAFLPKGVQHHGLGERNNLIKHLGCWPRLESVGLDRFSLKYLALADKVPQGPPIMLKHLKYVFLHEIRFDLDQVSGILSLLRSSAILKIWLTVSPLYSTDEKVLRYLDEPGHMNQRLEQLRTVKIKFFMGSEVELLFVKLLLGCSPSLEKMFVEELKELCPLERLRISKELMEFSRASAKAKLFFKPNIPMDAE